MPSSPLRSPVPSSPVSRAPYALAHPVAVHTGIHSDQLSVRELGDERVIISDPGMRTLHVVDFRTARTTPIGCPGSGRSEWGAPGRLLPLPGDVTVMLDDVGSRFFIIGPDAKPAPHLRPHVDAFSRKRLQAAIAGGMMGAKATDASGRVYYEVHAEAPGASAEWIPIVRYDPANGAHDTVAHISAESMTRGTRRLRARWSASVRPFAPADEWTVLPDGRVAVVRAKDYHVVIIQNRQRVVASAPLAFAPIRVSEADKDQYRASRRVEHRVLALTRDAIPAAHPAEPVEWPETKPPFAAGSVWATREARIVVVRSRAAGDHVPTADIFDARGQFAGTLVLPEHARIAGFGARCVYVNRRDANRIQHIEKHALPGFATH